MLAIITWFIALSALQFNGASPMDPFVQSITASHVVFEEGFIGREWACTPEYADNICFAGITWTKGDAPGYVINLDD